MSWANDYIRVPFAEHGRRPDGADCWGLVCLVYKDVLGIDVPPLTDYSNTKDVIKIPSIIAEESSKWRGLPLGQEKPFDVVVFRILGLAMHVGIVVKPGIMLHCERGTGTAISDYVRDQRWSKRIEGFFRHANYSDRSATVCTTS